MWQCLVVLAVVVWSWNVSTAYVPAPQEHELLTIVTLARFKYELPDDGHRPKHGGAF